MGDAVAERPLPERLAYALLNVLEAHGCGCHLCARGWDQLDEWHLALLTSETEVTIIPPVPAARPAHNCEGCGGHVVVRDNILGGEMVCDVITIVVGGERRDWGTSGPHFCKSNEGD